VLDGAVTVIAGLIAARFGPVVGGLFLAFPAIFPASATLIERHVRERREKAGLSGTRRGGDAAAQLQQFGSSAIILGPFAHIDAFFRQVLKTLFIYH
jgi:hypothetical protein